MLSGQERRKKDEADTMRMDRRDCDARGWKRSGPASGAPGESPERCATGCQTGNGGESLEHRGKEPIAALLEEYGGGRGSHARGKIWFQAHAGNELLRPSGNAHRAVQQRSVLENFRDGCAGREDGGHRPQGQAGGGAKGFV